MVWSWIKKANEDTEKFTAINYRAYGSQQQLLQSTRELSGQTSLLQHEALEAFMVLGNLKIPKEELSKYNGKSAVARAYLDNVIIDEKGRVVYFEYDGIKVWADGMVRELNVSIARMNKIMSNAPAMEPPTIDGKPVAAHTGIFLQDYEIEIADKNISWRNNRLGDDRGRYFKARPAK